MAGRKRVGSMLLASTLAMALALALPAAAQPFVQRLNAGVNAVADTQFGFSVATDGRRVVVGEIYGLTGAAPAVPAGAVEVWRLEGGAMVREQRLLAPQPVAGHLFGGRVALSGDRLAVAERGVPGSVGQVHVFSRAAGTWQHEQTLDPTQPGNGHQVAGLAMRGDRLLLGLASGEGSVGGAPGRVEVWRRDGAAWQSVQVLQPLDSSPADGFGLAVDLGEGANGQVFAAVGAPFRDQARGALYLFALDGSTFVQEQRLLLPQAAAGEAFGLALALRGDLVVGGAPDLSSPGPGSGRIGLWRRAGAGDFPWLADNVFGGNGGAAGDRFGQAVALATPRDLAVGAPQRDVVPPIGPVLVDVGAATGYARRRSGVACPTLWSGTGGLGNPGAPAQAETYLGWSLAASTLVAIGAPTGEVAGVGRAGFVDVLVHDRLLDSDFDCSH